MFTSLATLGTLLVLGAGGVAEHWQLSYTLGTGVSRCPSEDELRGGISDRLGHDPFTATAPSRVSVAVEQVGRQLRGRVLLERGPEEKVREQQFTSGLDDCRDLASAMELAVAIAIDPMSLMRFGPPQAPPPSVTAAVPGVPPAVPPPPGAPPEALIADRGASGRLVSRLILGGELSVGSQPEVGGGVLLAFEVQWKRWILGVEADVLFPATGALGGGEIQTSLVGGKLLPCVDLSVLGACAVLWAAAERAEIRPPDPSVSPTTNLMLALGGRAFRDLALSPRFFLRGQVDILVPVYYSPLTVDFGADEWKRPPLSLTLGVGVGWRLP